jgi:hypothetical protein
MELPELTPWERRTEELLARAPQFNKELVRIREQIHQLGTEQETASRDGTNSPEAPGSN